ncbi:MAG: thioredoxin [Nitrospirae bacterium CG_4_10_14_3_um_filter_44_29]|nr:TlpA family protein disulfide reductase [Nitrospirota bacterium]OIO28256.1 MAG: hypothetical protein AUJ60_07520 [Nitrospirae bacterium CG1_02_44_142]PIV40761.1 MAG: thioredoxin [Nitrospirae bacterium CG02_land_8_20_14_3_00_44_33]PIV66141.1 MAG: thioredoxin [Nitrospirae bacterium CG01_land_8_20_14_3_00_44_22]PIW88578.1 MAG: thioredoxin [Nitrospirae bacterium CG_4_8_14_3_um_filter_44_28]PIX87940.1 MAG: thioredoxin [Nitrospirae bacterium CG_4_10_14_3_um_filter_44_29]PJA81314.1 MAG: thioredox
MKNKSIILIALLLIGIFLIAYGLISRRGMKEKSVFVGLYIPEFELENAADGKRILSSDLKGKVLFINFWASWCSPCREEMPSIAKLSKHFSSNQDFIILPILFRDSPQDAVNYLKESRFNLPVLIDREGKAARVYGLRGIPETFIVDKKGVLRKKVIGPYEWDSPDVLALISSLLKE